MTCSTPGCIVALAASLSAASCGPHVGGLVVDRWSVLADGNWSLEPGAEDASWCKTIVMTETTYVSAIRPIAPSGTHHISLTVATPDEHDCTAGRFGPATVYASGPGASELRFPPHVAMKLSKGEALHLNLHVYNPTSTRLAGASGIEVIRVKEEAVESEAGFVLAGQDGFTLPPATRTTIAHTCRVGSDQTAVALIPLMHKLGVQFRVSFAHGSDSTVLHDGAFRFEEQSHIPIGPVLFQAGDAITTECTYENTKYHPVTPGHGNGEMCFSALLRFPSDALLDCAEVATQEI
jgi:hypothetical protein